MGYYTGNAADAAAVITAIVNSCVAEGWDWTDSVLSNTPSGATYPISVKFSSATVSGYAPVRLWCKNSSDAWCPYYVTMCVPVKSVNVTYPVTYHIFVFDAEVFAVVNYSDKYQWLAFGQSDQPGLGGSGNWMAATMGHLNSSSPDYPTDGVFMTLSEYGLNHTYDKVICPGLGWSDKGAALTGSVADWQLVTNFWMDSGVESSDFLHPWMYTAGALGNQDERQCGIRWAVPLLLTQPNNFNNEGVLLPIKVFQRRPSYMSSQVLQVQNARQLRVDNYASGEIIQLGTDQWMIFPWYRKNSAARDCGQNVDHSGTFGWAIKYEPA